LKTLGLLLFLAAPTLAATDAADMADVDGQRVESEDDALAREMRDRLATDPAAADVLTERIMRSRLAKSLGGDEEPDVARQQIRRWISANPESAGYLAVGFASDDANGTATFESSLFLRITRHFQLSPDRHKGILGRLDAVGSQSKLLSSSEDVDDEDRGKILADFFRGDGRSDGSVGDKGDAGSGSSTSPAAAASHSPVAAGGLYDRMSSANVTGYSPEVMTFQSAMNRQRPPGAPQLIETGKLDYPTLRQPYYGLKYDVTNLERAYRRQRAWAQARLNGQDRGLKPKQYDDPQIQQQLEKAASGRDPGAFYSQRRAAIRSANDALMAFDREAARGKNPRGITAARIRNLSAKRRAAARLIALAKQLERIQRLAELEKFFTPKLREAIRRLPVDKKLKDAYAARGHRLERGIREARVIALATVEQLKRGDIRSLIAAEAGMRRSAGALKKYTPAVAAYREAPLHVEALPTGWRGKVDRLAARYLTMTEYGRAKKKKLDAIYAGREKFRIIANRR
jgi:hypothetical protein